MKEPVVPEPKPLPNGSIGQEIELLVHPEANPTAYVPFQNADLYRFQPRSGPPSRVNAWWLAEAAWVSYFRSEVAVHDAYANTTGLTAHLYEFDATAYTIASNADFAICAFRGTQPDSLVNILTDAEFVPTPWDVGYVHEGFARALEVAWKELSKTLDSLSSSPVWFTGHSLGAALATLAALRFKAASGVCTIGSPLVGNGDFVAAFNEKLAQTSLRYVNNRDIVTHLPPAALAAPHGLYQHVNTLRWIAPDGSVQPASASPTGLFDRVFDSRRAFVPIQMDIARLRWLNLPDALRDHTPLRYVIDVWNDFATSA